METTTKSKCPRERAEIPVVSDALCVEALRLAWKTFSSRAHHSIIRDPLDHLAFSTNSDSFLSQLSYALREGTYRPSPPTLISLAKRDGTSRQLTFCDLEDSIVLCALTDALTPMLLKDFPSCVKYSLGHRPAFILQGQPELAYQTLIEDDEDFGYDTWLKAWREHTENLRAFAAELGCKHVALIDVASFFPSINHCLLRQFIYECVESQERTVNLLFYILDELLPRHDYERPEKGLPIIEDMNPSRVLAHSYFKRFDSEFQKEIEDGRFARWMDDVAIAIQTEEEGEELLGRAQSALAQIHLRANEAKTRVVSINHLHASLWTEQNEYLDRVDGLLGQGDKVCLDEFETKLKQFLVQEGSNAENWDRCLRRFYTFSRHVGSTLLKSYWPTHLREYPASADRIIRYLWAQRHDKELADELFSYLQSDVTMYQAEEVRIAELLLHFRLHEPSELNAWFTRQILDWFFCRSSFDGRTPPIDYVRGILTLAAYKFGTADDVGEIARYALCDKVHTPEFYQYCLYVFTGTDQFSEGAMAVASKLEHKNMRRLSKFLIDIESSPESFDVAAKKFVNLKRREKPFYKWLDARALPMVRILDRKQDYKVNWRNHLQSIASTLRLQEGNFQDKASIEFLDRVMSLA